MLKKIFSLSMAALSIVSLASCGPTNEEIELRIGFWPESQEKQDVAMYTQWKEAFEKDYPQYKIVGDPYMYSPDTIGQKVISGTLPTVFQTWFTEPQKLVEKKFIRSIHDELSSLGWLDVMDKDMKNALTFNNKVYGIPRDGYGLGLLINLKTFWDVGLIDKDENGDYIIYNDDGSPLYPTTFEEIYDASVEICDATETKGILICSANKNGGWQLANMDWNYGSELIEESNGKVTATLNKPGVVEALSWIQRMKQDDLLLKNTSIVYDDWYDAIESKVAMAIVGSDVIHLAGQTAKMNMDDLAFVPMPTGDGEHHYSLYGGTPYVFSKDATDEQVEGILKFFDYIGRSPNVNEISKDAMKIGNEVARNKNQPIVPKIRPWTNSDYVAYQDELDEEYVSVDMRYYEEFFNTIGEYKHPEVQYYSQDMYEALDIAIQAVLNNPDTANPSALLTTANATYQKVLDKEVNK